MKNLRGVLLQSITSEGRALWAGTLVCFATAILVLAAGFPIVLRLADGLDLHCFVALLMVAGVSLMFVLLGFLCNITKQLSELG